MLCHRLFKVFNLLLGVAINECLVEVQISIEIQENVHLPLFLLYGDVVLVNTFEGQLLVLDQDLCGLSHELLGHADDLWGQIRGEKCNLDVLGQELENSLNLDLVRTG
jgi:hypothetical protein